MISRSERDVKTVVSILCAPMQDTLGLALLGYFGHGHDILKLMVSGFPFGDPNSVRPGQNLIKTILIIFSEHGHVRLTRRMDLAKISEVMQQVMDDRHTSRWARLSFKKSSSLPFSKAGMDKRLSFPLRL